MLEAVPLFRRMRHRKNVVLSDQAFVEQKLRLPQVTLICVDTANPDLALRALNHSMRWISFGAAVLVTAPNHTLSPPPGLQIVANETISTVRDYSRFMLRDLLPYVDTSHCLVVQWDGYVLDPTMWRDKFMEFDYLGPIWERFRNAPRCSCTGGFTLRSRRLLAALRDEEIQSEKPEDVCIALEYRDRLQDRYGIHYADFEIARQFAIEDLYERPSAFGFHGVHNLMCLLSDDELSEFLTHAPDNVFSGFRMRRFINQALKNHESDLARHALIRRRSSVDFQWSELRLWLRLYREQLFSRLVKTPAREAAIDP